MGLKRKIRIPTPSPRVWLGISLIAVSIAGMAYSISLERSGTEMILATQFIPAGTIVTESDVTVVRVKTNGEVVLDKPPMAVGHRASVDIAAGDAITSHSLDGTVSARRIVAVPLETPPLSVLKPGDRLQLWFTSSQLASVPLLVARDAILVSALSSGFGAGDRIEVSISARDEIHLVTALGESGTLVAVKGDFTP